MSSKPSTPRLNPNPQLQEQLHYQQRQQLQQQQYQEHQFQGLEARSAPGCGDVDGYATSCSNWTYEGTDHSDPLPASTIKDSEEPPKAVLPRDTSIVEGVEGPRIPAGVASGLDCLDWPQLFSTQSSWDQCPEPTTHVAEVGVVAEPNYVMEKVPSNFHMEPASGGGVSSYFQSNSFDSFGSSAEICPSLAVGPTGSAKYSSQGANLFVRPSVAIGTLEKTAGDRTATDMDAPRHGCGNSLMDSHYQTSVSPPPVRPNAQVRVAKLAEYAQHRGWLMEQAQLHVEWLADQALHQGGTTSLDPEEAYDALHNEPGPHDELNQSRSFPRSAPLESAMWSAMLSN